MSNIAGLNAGVRAQMKTDTIETGKALEASIANMMVLPTDSDIPTIIAATCLTSGFDGEHATGLLYGTHGTNKTRLIEALAEAIPDSTGYRYQLTENTRALDPTLETVIADDGNGYKTIFYPKGIFLADFVHLDEVSRAMPSTQSGFMEFLAEGKVHDPNGNVHQANGYRTVFGTMNETDPRLGSYPLPPAQLDRFSISAELPELRTRADQQKALEMYYHRIRGEEPERKDERKIDHTALSLDRYQAARDYVGYEGLNTVNDSDVMGHIHNVVETTRSLRRREEGSNDSDDDKKKRVLDIGADGNRLLFVLAGLTTAVGMVKGTGADRDAVYIAARYALPHRMSLEAKAQVGSNKVNIQQVTERILEKAL